MKNILRPLSAAKKKVSGKSMSLFAIITMLLLTNPIKAQVLTESFEEAGWIVGSNTNSTAVGAATASGGNSIWTASSIIVSSNTGTVISAAKTGKGVLVGGTSSSFVCTPVFSGGVTTVTLAVYPSAAGARFLIGIATNTATTNTAQLTSSTSSAGSTGTAATGIWTFSQFIAGSATTGGSNLLSGAWNTITFTTNVPAGQSAMMKFQRIASGSTVIDDIVINGSVVTPEPSNHVTNPAAANIAPTESTIQVTWNDAVTGAQAPQNYLVLASTGAITTPVDGTPQADGTLAKNIAHISAGSANSATFTGLNSLTTYNFAIYPYTNTGSIINYKTDGVVPTASAMTSAPPPPYRSLVNGNWGDASTWEMFDGANWIPAVMAPTFGTASTITIVAGDTVTVAVPLTIDETVIETNAAVIVPAASGLTVNNGTGTDLLVDGLFQLAGTFTSSASSTMTVNGTFENQVNNATFSAAPGAMTISAGGTFKENGYNGGAVIVLTNVTLAANSNLYIATSPLRIPTPVAGNVIWNTPTAGGTFLNGNTTIGGNLTVIGTTGINNGSGGTGRSLTISGNLIMQGGEYDVQANPGVAAQVTTVNGDVTVSGGKLYASSGGSNGTLNIKGNLNHTGGELGVAATNSPLGTIVFNGTSPQNISTTGFKDSVSVTFSNTTGVTLNTPATFHGTVTFGTGAILNSNGNMILKSDATRTGRIAAIPVDVFGVALATINGNVVMERYSPGLGSRAYRYLAHPFSNPLDLGSTLQQDILISGPTDPPFDVNPGSTSPSAFHYDATTNSYSPFTTTTNADLWIRYEGIAIVVRGQRPDVTGTSNVTLHTRGLVNRGDQGIAMPGNAGSDIRLIGNPFPSQVNMSATTTRTNLNTGFYVWDLTMGLPEPTNPKGKGGFKSVLYTGDPTYTTGYILQSSQAFFAEVTTPAIEASLLFPESSKVSTAPTDLNFRTTAPTNYMALELHSGSTFWDRTQIVFDNTLTTAKEYDDMNKMRNPQVSLFSYSSDNKELSIDFRPVNAGSVIPLGLIDAPTGNFTFRATNFHLPSNLNVYIKDKYNSNSLTLLLDNGTYNFSITADPASAAVNRFELVFAPASPLPLTLTNIKAYQKNSGIQVDWNVENESGINGYEVERSSNGLQFSKLGTVQSLSNGASSLLYNYFDANPVNGVNYYRLKIIEKNGASSYSKVVKVTLGKSITAINIYPNPIIDNTVTIEFNNVAKGVYNISLTNKLGQVIYRSTINHNGGSATETLSVNNDLSAGTYQLQVIGTDFKKLIQIVKE